MTTTTKSERYQDFLLTHDLDIRVRAYEDEQRYYAFCPDYPEVPPVSGRRIGRTVERWLEDFGTALLSGEVKP